MSGPGGTSDIGSTMSLRSSYKRSTIDSPTGKLNSLSVKGVSIQNLLPSAKGALKQGIKKIADFSSIVMIPCSLGCLTRPNSIVSADAPPPPNKPELNNEEIHNEILESRLVDKESTDLQIKSGRKQKSWQKLEKNANPANKKAINDKGFKRLMAALNKKDVGRNNDLKLMVLFAAYNFEEKKLSPDQMKQYMDVLVNKYTIARAEEQVRASVLSLAPTGSERTGFGNDVPLKASESVQIAELIATTGERLDATDVTDGDSGVVHNYKRDFPLSLYGWELDVENISKAVDTRLSGMLPEQLKDSLIRDAGSKDLATTPEFEKQLVEGIHRSIDEFADSLLRAASSRVDNPIKKDTSVRESEKIIKTKLARRREQLVSILQNQLGKGVAHQAMEISIDKMVGHKVELWVKKHEMTSDEKDPSAVRSKYEKTSDSVSAESTQVIIDDFELSEGKTVENWADLLLSHCSEDEQSRVDKAELMQRLTEKALEMDIRDDLILSENSESPFVRNSTLRKAVRRRKAPGIHKRSVSVTGILKEAVVTHEQKNNEPATSKPTSGIRMQGSVQELIDFFEAVIEKSRIEAGKGFSGHSSTWL